MNWIVEDPDEWETVAISETYGKYPGTDLTFGMGGVERRRRPPEEVARIKAERLRKEEDDILAKGEAIRARRAMESNVVSTGATKPTPEGAAGLSDYLKLPSGGSIQLYEDRYHVLINQSIGRWWSEIGYPSEWEGVAVTWDLNAPLVGQQAEVS